MTTNNRFSLHIKLVQAANAVLTQEIDESYAKELSAHLDKYNLGEPLDSIEIALKDPVEKNSFISQEDLDTSRKVIATEREEAQRHQEELSKAAVEENALEETVIEVKPTRGRPKAEA